MFPQPGNDIEISARLLKDHHGRGVVDMALHVHVVEAGRHIECDGKGRGVQPPAIDPAHHPLPSPARICPARP